MSEPSTARQTRLVWRPLSVSTWTKIESILLAVTIFMALGALTALALQRPLRFGIIDTCLTGIVVGLFEEFYVQRQAGRRMRSMHPLQGLLIYAGAVTVFTVIIINLSHLVLGSLEELVAVDRRLPIIIPVYMLFSVIGVVVMRAVHFIGPTTLFHLMVGTYHRPVSEAKILMFLDMNGSTALAQQLGAFRIRALVGKFIFDISKPISDFGGDVHLYKGDGLIALWDWHRAVRGGNLLQAVDAIYAVMRRETPVYRQIFGLAPTFRIGIHGGNVVVCEQGDSKRAIGIYGDAINMTARMEDAAKLHGVGCVISEAIVDAFDIDPARLTDLGSETFRGIPVPVRIWEYRPRDDSEAGHGFTP